MMKKVLLSLLLLAVSPLVFGQKDAGSLKKIAPNPFNKTEKIANEKAFVRGVSPTTVFLILDLEQRKLNPSEALSDADLVEKYSLIEKENGLYANSFITTANGIDVALLDNYGVLTGTIVGNALTGLIPIGNIESFANEPGIKYVEIGDKAFQTMDSARSVTNVNKIHAGIGLNAAYQGEDVIVGIIDQGFDYTHPNFYDSSGNHYRVLRVWEQGKSGGTPPSGYSYGRELVNEQMIMGARGDVTSSHATHVAGIAGGSGGGTTPYKGVAPKSDLVFVATTMTIPNVFDGIGYIQRYAKSVNKPCVINMSLGSQIGPHDGTSSFDILADSFYVGPGRILVGSAGNDGNKKLHFEKTFTTTDTTASTFVVYPSAVIKSKGTTAIDIWGEVGKDFQVGVYIYNIATNAYEDGTTQLYSARGGQNKSFTFRDSDNERISVSMSSGVDPNNSKPRMLLEMNSNGQSSSNQQIMVEVRGVNTKVQMWATSAEFENNGYAAPIIAGNTNTTISEIGGTAKKIITVGSFVSKKTWVSYSAGPRSGSGTIGDIAASSSRGPAADGTLKPDIAAPGKVIASSVSSFDTKYTTTNTNVVAKVSRGSDEWFYSVMEGTSMASPMVTGTIALWLSMSSELTYDQVLRFLKDNAIVDSFTGTIPANGSNTWGYGKLNSFVDIPSLTPEAVSLSPTTDSLCGEGDSVVLIAPSGYTEYKWSNGAQTQSIVVNRQGTYRVKVRDTSAYFSPWSNVITVVNVTPITPGLTQKGDTLISGSAVDNQWYKDGNPIAGATQQKYKVTAKGKYKVVVTNEFGCSAESMEIDVTPSGIENTSFAGEGIQLYPNPANDYINIKFYKDFKKLSFRIYDNLGKVVHLAHYNQINNNQVIAIGTQDLPAGIYNLSFFSEGKIYSARITVLK